MRRFRSLMALTLAVSVLAGCGGKKSDAPATPASAQTSGPVEITFWHAMGGDLGKALEEQIKQFHAAQNKVRVKAEFQQSYDVTGQKLQAALAAGNPPDAVQLNTRVWPAFAAAGALAPVADFIKQDQDFKMDDLDPGLLVNSKWDGKLYTMPYNRSTPLLYYNKDLLKQAGFDPEKPPQTWDELVSVAKKITVKDGSGQSVSYGFGASLSGWYFYSLVWSNGGEILGADKKSALTRPEAARGMQLWVDLLKEGTMRPPTGGTSTSGSAAGQTLEQDFVQGRIGFYMESTGSMGSLEKQVKFNMGATFLPKFQEFAVPTGGANGAILAKSPKEKQQAAYAFLKFLASKEQTIFFSKTTGYLPVRTSAVNAPEMQEHYKQHPLFKVAVEQLKYAREVPNVPQIKQVETELNTAMEKAAVGKLSVEQVLKETSARIDEALKQ